MDELYNNQNEIYGRTVPKREIPQAPPGFSEAVIRTMSSDMKSIAEGGMPKYEALDVGFDISDIKSRNNAKEYKSPELPENGAYTPEVSIKSEGTKKGAEVSKSRKNIIAIWSAAGALIVAGMFLVGYYIIPYAFPPKNEHSKIPQISTSTIEKEQSQLGNKTTQFKHVSFFRVPSEKIFDVDISTSSPHPIGLYNKQILEAVKKMGAKNRFFEINIKSGGEPFPWSSFLSMMNIKSPGKSFWDKNFYMDFTAFVYEDKNGLWPGYIVKVKEGSLPVILQPDILKIEGDKTSMRNLFLEKLGAANGEFKTTQIDGEPVRYLEFETPGAAISYGWFFNNYFIISTSIDGLKQAVQRL